MANDVGTPHSTCSVLNELYSNYALLIQLAKFLLRNGRIKFSSGGLQSVTVAFPDHSHLLYHIEVELKLAVWSTLK